MEPLERAELLMAKAKDDEILLEEIISNADVGRGSGQSSRVNGAIFIIMINYK